MSKKIIKPNVSEWDVDLETIKEAFLRGVSSGAGSKGKPVNEASLSALMKFLPKENYDETQIIFKKHSVANKISLDVFVTQEWFCLMCRGKDKEEKEKKAKTLAHKLEKNEQAAKAAKGPPKDTGVTGRLTDASGYTGAHKERFGKDGKGKGKEGRVDGADTSGYVGNYKGEGTFQGDKK